MRRHVAGAGAVLLVFTGAWLGHTLEYLRLTGASGLGRATVGLPHLYMLPLGALLTLLLADGGRRWWRRWADLGARLEHARAALRQAMRGRRTTAPGPVVLPRLPVRLLWGPLAVAQLLLYLLQENVEALAAGRPAPGLGAITGIHWAAPLIHAAVALGLAALVALAGRRLWHRAERVLRCERLAAHLGRLRGARSRQQGDAAAWRPSPLQRFGAQLWSRPPPA
ncbi:MAG TPA: hypothetical protein VH134_04465 [Candidatus Dormibacteraeota bacterium]|nr:hypothetical protein [Candidatus Dormibacteraeota bacterium]